MQGFNMGRYVPPEHEGLTTGNKLHKKRPPGFHGNTQTVRFEMPFNMFCSACSGHIAQGVRFNAEKKKIGSYFSTPIFSFRIRHTVCSNVIEIRTDPKNTAYVVAEGGKKKTADEIEEGEIRIREQGEEGKEGLENPFAKLEKGVKDKEEAKTGKERIEQLLELSNRQWEDPYTHSRKMRKIFREKRKDLAAAHAESESIRTRLALSIPLLPVSPADAAQAKLIEFGPTTSQNLDLEIAASKPLFPLDEIAKKEVGAKTTKGMTKAQIAAESSREKLQTELRRNTRARVDPFLNVEWGRGSAARILKRKVVNAGDGEREGGEGKEEEVGVATEGGGKVVPGVSLGLEGRFNVKREKANFPDSLDLGPQYYLLFLPPPPAPSPRGETAFSYKKKRPVDGTIGKLKV
ncbi:Protein saf4 [Rhizina undulata]